MNFPKNHNFYETGFWGSLINRELYSELKYDKVNKFTCGFIYNINQENYLCSSSEGGYIIIWDLFKKSIFKTIEIKKVN